MAVSDELPKLFSDDELGEQRERRAEEERAAERHAAEERAAEQRAAERRAAEQPNGGSAASNELPRLFSDDELSEQRERRELAERRAAERRAAERRAAELRAEEDLIEERRTEERRTEERRVTFVWGRRTTDGLPASTIEQKFPHIAKKLTLAWRSDACSAYIMSLSVADRPGRQGFPAEVMEDLMMLHQINDMLMGKSALEQPPASPPAWKEPSRRKPE